MRMRVFKTKGFSRFARKERLSNAKLAEAVRGIECGLHDGDLGGHLIKKRMARAGGQASAADIEPFLSIKGGAGQCFSTVSQQMSKTR